MHVDPKSMAAILSAIIFAIFRWRWDYIRDYLRHPGRTLKYLLLWGLLALLLLRIFWQLKPEYFG